MDRIKVKRSARRGLIVLGAGAALVGAVLLGAGAAGSATAGTNWDRGGTSTVLQP